MRLFQRPTAPRADSEITIKRFHAPLHVDDLAKSVGFDSKLFATVPARLEGDDAKWMLEDPPVNFAIATRGTHPDPAVVEGADAQKAEAFMDTAITLKRRIELMLSLPLNSLAGMSLQREIDPTGKTGA